MFRSRSIVSILAASLLLFAACSDGGGVSVNASSPETDPEPAPEETAEPEQPEEQEDPTPPEETPEPEPEETPEEPEPEAELGAEAEAAVSAQFEDLTPDQVVCILEQIGEEPDLASAVVSGADLDDLPLEDQASVATMAVQCAPEAVAASVAAGDSEAAELADCFIPALGSDPENTYLVMLALLSIDAGEPVPEEAKAPTVDAFVSCADSEEFQNMMIEEIADDPAAAAAFDQDCFTESLSGETMRPLFEFMVDNPEADFDEMPPENMTPMMEAMFSCVSFGDLMAEEAAADGVTLSQETIDCIDSQFDGETLAAMFAADSAGDDSSDEVIANAVFGCLSPEELEQLANS